MGMNSRNMSMKLRYVNTAYIMTITNGTKSAIDKI